MSDSIEPMVLRNDRDGVAHLTLNRPAQFNALSDAMLGALSEQLEVIGADESVRVVVIGGAGKAFCAGGQLKDLTPNQEMLESIYSGFLSIANCTLPTIAAINGPAVGAGFNMAVGCDVRIVTDRARFEPRFFGLGLHPGGGNTWMLRQLANWNTAAGMLLFSQSISGAEAVEKGLAWKCVEADSLVEEAIAFTANIRDLPKELLLRTKQTLRQAGGTNSHKEMLEIETTEQIWSINQPYARESIAAMMAKISSKP